jgi:hypothetical protein
VVTVAAELSPVETLRAAAAELRENPEWAYDVVNDVADPLADWLDETAGHLAENVAVWVQPTTTVAQVDVAYATEFHYGRALRVARVLLGVPDGV